MLSIFFALSFLIMGRVGLMSDVAVSKRNVEITSQTFADLIKKSTNNAVLSEEHRTILRTLKKQLDEIELEDDAEKV